MGCIRVTILIEDDSEKASERRGLEIAFTKHDEEKVRIRARMQWMCDIAAQTVEKMLEEGAAEKQTIERFAENLRTEFEKDAEEREKERATWGQLTHVDASRDFKNSAP